LQGKGTFPKQKEIRTNLETVPDSKISEKKEAIQEIKNVKKVDQLNQQELFAPVLVFSVFNDLDEIIDSINESAMGLAGYVFSKDKQEIQKCEQKIDIGMLGVNTGKISNAQAAFGGVKHSGFGREGGRIGVEEFLTIHYSAR
ncbi:MAG: aldehyde dehydrogenase family protein, partial [Saccharospirillaceae bacterium]|nr:aldehyde dehydrogenase family protein [Pseudomonadales bacterium]NRB77899.1 aldehyde dehydrogenase family protein [Saccharospirillaceae bacterium]